MLDQIDPKLVWFGPDLSKLTQKFAVGSAMTSVNLLSYDFFCLLPLGCLLSTQLAPKNMQSTCSLTLGYLPIVGVFGMNVFATWEGVEH